MAREFERGQVLVVFVGAIFALLMVVALAVDVGSWRNQQRQEQSAADAAALAGSIALYYKTTTATPAPVEVQAAAAQAATKNGYTDDSATNSITTTTITVNSPPTTGSHTADSTAVEVIVTKKQSTFFGGVFGLPTTPVTARSVANHTADLSPACAYQLNQLTGFALNSGTLDASSCSIEVNSLVNVGSGNCSAKSEVYFGLTAPSCGATQVVKATAPISDPCYRIAGCAYLANSTIPPIAPPNATPTATKPAKSDNFTAPSTPGYLYVSGNITVPTTFDPGIYFVYGDITAQITGTNVTIVHVSGNTTFAGTDAPSIIAPTTGPTAGIAYYQTSTGTITLDGASSSWQGLFYAPNSAGINHGDGNTFSSLIVGSWDIRGKKDFSINPASASADLQSLQSTTHAALAE